MINILIIYESGLAPHGISARNTCYYTGTVAQWRKDPHKFEGIELDAIIYQTKPPAEMEAQLKHRLVRRNGTYFFA